MNSGVTAERVYDALRRRILSREFRPGDRLDPALLSETLASSVTPVRDALHLLTGEHLVETRPGDGFHIPHVTEPDLRDLYAWNAELVLLAMRSGRHPSSTADEDATTGDVAALFAAIGRRSVNSEHGKAIATVNARLHVARLLEPHVLGTDESELATMATAFDDGDAGALRRFVRRYHRHRLRHAAEIVRALYRDA